MNIGFSSKPEYITCIERKYPCTQNVTNQGGVFVLDLENFEE